MQYYENLMNKINTKKGQIIIINTLLFFALSIAIIFAVTSPVISSYNITKSFLKSKQSFLLANSVSNEILYKLHTNKNLTSSETITLSQGSAEVTIADTISTKIISVKSNVDSYEKNYEMELSIGSGVSFNYGIQVGEGGFLMSGNAQIIGNVYSNGNIIGDGGASITGTAVSASVSSPVLAASNIGDINPTNQIDFGGSTTLIPQDVAQSFSVSTTTPVSSIRLLLKKTGNTLSNIDVHITSNNNGKPHKSALASATINASTITSNFNFIQIPFSSNTSLVPGNTYWIVFDTSNLEGPYYSIGANNGEFAGGQAKISTSGWNHSNGGTWNTTNPESLDTYFSIYLGSSSGKIEGVTIGSSGEGDAWAYEVKDSIIEGNLYCQIGSGNNKEECNITRSAPVQQSWPISDGNIEEWKTEASDGGSTSTVSISNSEVKSLGPIKINGNLNVTSGAILNLDGTIYVTGDVNVGSNAIIRANPALGSTGAILITDGRVISSGGGQFQGSGAPNSYILLVTTSSCPDSSGCDNQNAIEIIGGAGAVALNAQKGSISFSGGAQARQVTANKIIMAGGTSVIYESGLVNPSFTAGPSGSWKIDSWKEVE